MPDKNPNDNLNKFKKFGGSNGSKRCKTKTHRHVLTAIIPKGSRKNNTANMVAITINSICMNAIKTAHFLLYFDNACIIFVFHHIHIN